MLIVSFGILEKISPIWCTSGEAKIKKIKNVAENSDHE